MTSVNDVSALKASLSSTNSRTRIAAVLTLSSVLKEDVADVIKPMLKDKQEKVRLIAARELANVGNRDSLLALWQLLESTDISIRAQSIGILRSVTGQKFDYFAYGKAKDREIAANHDRRGSTSGGRRPSTTGPSGYRFAARPSRR